MGVVCLVVKGVGLRGVGWGKPHQNSPKALPLCLGHLRVESGQPFIWFRGFRLYNVRALIIRIGFRGFLIIIIA